MTTRMLIDARHREETRVAVVKGNRIEEFDFESAERKQLKGNIYLAKVTRVEPSLQAAFIDYGGNRHGFLAFSEIHPDYYQIPKEDREALLREEAEHAAEEEKLTAELDADHDDDVDAGADDRVEPGDEDAPEAPVEASRSVSGSEENTAEALRSRRMALRRRYKIQDVIHRRQILLVQVVKEERGNKGAAMTTYLSLAGRYCVLMPNTTHGGGISRKISNAADRKRLKAIMAEMSLPRSMGCIVRTAGLSRTKTEIKRDFDYLARLWDEVRETTLKASAPSLIYGDNDLVKRAIRDIYNRDIDEVIVEGESGHRAARDYMRLLMPSHARRVKAYADPVPLFQRFGAEDQLSQMYQPMVQLKSGGYLVINPTEALVSIDINSGRSTREHGIEATAVSTNLEAAGEIARQLRLRDMAGLVVIDFIDMENNGNVRKVEKAMKAALADDRARIQVGRISSFGLMEMSRQRLRTGVLEASTRPCPHCEGTGFVRTASSAGLSALRLIEEEAARGRGSRILLRASQEAAFYVLNHKRHELAEIEERYFVAVEIAQDGQHEGARMTVEASGPPPAQAPRFTPPPIEEEEDDFVDEADDELDEEIEREERERADLNGRGDRGDRPERDGRGDREERNGGRRRRRRGRRGRPGEGAEQAPAPLDGAGPSVRDAEDGDVAETEAAAPRADGGARDEANGETRRRGRRGRRGGRRNREGGASDPQRLDSDDQEKLAEAGLDAEPAEVAAEPDDVSPADPAPRRRRRGRAKPDGVAEADADVVTVAAEPEPVADAAPKPSRRRKVAAETTPADPTAEADADAPKPRRARRPRKAAETGVEDTAPIVAAPPTPAADNDADEAALVSDEDGPAGTPRRGWWQRTFGA